LIEKESKMSPVLCSNRIIAAYPKSLFHRVVERCKPPIRSFGTEPPRIISFPCTSIGEVSFVMSHYHSMPKGAVSVIGPGTCSFLNPETKEIESYSPQASEIREALSSLGVSCDVNIVDPHPMCLQSALNPRVLLLQLSHQDNTERTVISEIFEVPDNGGSWLGESQHLSGCTLTLSTLSKRIQDQVPIVPHQTCINTYPLPEESHSMIFCTNVFPYSMRGLDHSILSKDEKESRFSRIISALNRDDGHLFLRSQDLFHIAPPSSIPPDDLNMFKSIVRQVEQEQSSDVQRDALESEAAVKYWFWMNNNVERSTYLSCFPYLQHSIEETYASRGLPIRVTSNGFDPQFMLDGFVVSKET